MFFQIASIAVLAFASATHAATDCTQAPTSFQIYSNATGQYGQLGGPCHNEGCGVFFSVDEADATTYYTITSNGQLIIAPESTASPPNAIAGRVAYTFVPPGSQAYVEFGRKKTIMAQSSFGTMRCSVIDSPDGDGTCNLSCHSRSLVGDYVLTNNDDEWSLGARGSDFAPIQVKVVFPASG